MGRYLNLTRIFPTTQFFLQHSRKNVVTARRLYEHFPHDAGFIGIGLFIYLGLLYLISFFFITFGTRVTFFLIYNVNKNHSHSY